MSDTKKVIYFRDKKYGNGSGESFANAMHISSLVTEGYDGENFITNSGAWNDCDIRIEFSLTTKYISYPGVIQFKNTSITGGYIDNDTISPLITSNIDTYGTKLASCKWIAQHDNFIHVSRQFKFLGNCNVNYMQLLYNCYKSGEPSVIIEGDNNQFNMCRFSYCITGDTQTPVFIDTSNSYTFCDNNDNLYSIDISNATNTIITSCIFDANINSSRLRRLKKYPNIPPWQYCIGNEYNRGINDKNIIVDEDDPLKIRGRWRTMVGDICRFEMFGCSPYTVNNDNTLYIDTSNHGGYFTGIKYRNTEEQEFPIKYCGYTRIIGSLSDRLYIYFKRTGWGNIGDKIRTDNTGYTVEEEHKNQKFQFKNTTLNNTTSSILLSTNGILDEQSGLTYDNALPLCTIYELDEDKYKEDINSIKNKLFVGQLQINGNIKKYTYNHASQLSWYDNFEKYIKKVDNKPVILYDGLYDYIKTHPNQILGNSQCCVDAFSYVGNMWNGCDNITPHMLNDNILELDLAPKHIHINGGLTGSNNSTNIPTYVYTLRNNDNQTATNCSYFAHSGNCRPTPKTKASLICYGVDQHYYTLNNFDGCSIKIYDRYINPNTPFKVGKVDCTDSTYHMYSAAILSQKNVTNDIAPGGRCKRTFIVDENIRQRLSYCTTDTNVSEFWPSIISTCCYDKYHIAPCYGEFNNSTVGTLNGTLSRYYYERNKGIYLYNPINVGWLVSYNNYNCSDVGYGYISSLTLDNTLIAPPSDKDIMNVGIECNTLSSTNIITNSLLIAGTNAPNSLTLSKYVTGLDISKYNMIAFQGGSYMTTMELGLIPNNEFKANNVRYYNTFYSTTFTHDVGKNMRLIIHPFWNNIQYEYYDEDAEQFLPCQQLTPWIGGSIKSTCITAITANTLSSIPYAMYINTKYISSITTPFESNMVSSLSCYMTNKLN